MTRRTIAIVALSILIFSPMGMLVADPVTASSAETGSTFAALNQKWLDEFEKLNPNLLLYSLVPEKQTDPSIRDFTATFYGAESKRLTKAISYIRLNNVWQPRPPNLIDWQKITQGAEAKPQP